MREIKYYEALSEGVVQAMERDDNIFVTGIAVDYSSGIFGSTVEAFKRFRPSRVFDAPAMENAPPRAQLGPVSQDLRGEALGKGAVVRAGSDVTIVATSVMVIEALHAAEQLANAGVSAEVVDLRSIRPLDEETILTSVRKTGHL